MSENIYFHVIHTHTHTHTHTHIFVTGGINKSSVRYSCDTRSCYPTATTITSMCVQNAPYVTHKVRWGFKPMT
jgi:hypothetical protein